MARTGRPRKENVVRFPCGDIKEEIIPPPFNMELRGIEQRTIRDENNREVEVYESEPYLRALGRLSLLEDYQVRAGEEMTTLWLSMRRVALAALPPHPKVAKWERGFGHEPELTDDEVAKGLALQEEYDEAYDELKKCGLSSLVAVEAACFGEVLPWKLAEIRLDDLRKGLTALAVKFGYAVKKTRVA